MTVQVIQVTSKAQSTVRPGLWAERAPVAPFTVEKQTVFWNREGHAVRIERETVATIENMFEGFTAIEGLPARSMTRNECVSYTVLDATEHAVSFMDFALIHMGRAKFDAYVNGA